jgi:hypothetical protein
MANNLGVCMSHEGAHTKQTNCLQWSRLPQGLFLDKMAELGIVYSNRYFRCTLCDVIWSDLSFQMAVGHSKVCNGQSKANVQKTIREK